MLGIWLSFAYGSSKTDMLLKKDWMKYEHQDANSDPESVKACLCHHNGRV
jgi:hypothetical protein